MTEPLLGIDFGAALSKLATAQLAGREALPTEIVRLAIAAGAAGPAGDGAVAISLGRQSLSLEAAAAELDPDLVHHLAWVLDPSLADGERFEALLALEARDGVGLAALPELPWRRLELRGGGRRLRAQRGAPPSLAAGPAGGLRLEIVGLRLDRRRAAARLRAEARFAALTIRIDGEPIRSGFDAPLAVRRLNAPLPMAVAVLPRGPAPQLYLLRHGIVATRATVPGFPAFAAAVEMAGVTPAGAGAAALRERIDRDLEAVIEQAVDLLLEVAARAAELPEPMRRRVALLMLAAARRGLRPLSTASMPIFRVVAPNLAGESCRRRLASLDEVRSLAVGGGPLRALSPGDDPARFVLGDSPAVELSAAERGPLADLLGVEIAAVAARTPPRSGWRARLTDRFEDLRGALPSRARQLPAAAQSDAERAFVSRLAAALGDVPNAPTPVLVRGRGRVRRHQGRLLLPHRRPTVIDAIDACAHAAADDAPWLYPALIALLEGRIEPPPGLRRRWLAALQTEPAAAG